MNRSAKTGRAVTGDYTAANPDTTVHEGPGRDTARLSWLGRQGRRMQVRIMPSGLTCITDADGTEYRGKTPRKAIDQAMKVQGLSRRHGNERKG